MQRKRLKLASIGFAVLMFILPADAAGSLHITKMTEKSTLQGLDYSCSYPRLNGATNSLNQQKLNVRFREMALTAMKAAEYEVKTAQGSSASGSYDYEVKRNAGGILSMKLTDTLTAGGSSRTNLGGVTVDTVTGSTYRLDDLFFDNADYVTMINREVMKQISQKGLQSRLKDFRSIRKNSEYYLTNDSLVVLAKNVPEDMAVLEFTVTLKSLEGSLKPELRLST